MITSSGLYKGGEIVDFNQIQKIIKEFEDSKLLRLELAEGDFHIKMEKASPQVHETIVKQIVGNQLMDNLNTYQVKSPLVGTFYSAISPKDKPYVRVGQRVNEGDTLCIIEAMKIMNEINAPISGVIAKININNGDPVGIDQVLMEIETK